ncbi:acetyltransferase [Belliella sp. DSM 111904]|uniref:Acetyltransferase n=1 Tax=Belliella filtrata TaxID=2923435 RepID=A0ABS9UX58_9BACT|nr:acetyltransferase [Belliella filtrata]MCH7408643.1 acetyltransferase [Belliella filtrata]
MILVGAGGHALEVLDILEIEGKLDIKLYDDINPDIISVRNYRVIKNKLDLLEVFKNDNQFVIAVGNPKHRQALYQFFKSLGGELVSLRSQTSTISKYSSLDYVDVMDQCFIGPYVKIGKGTLINTAANVHHESTLGEFVEIGPGAVILGKVKIGSFTLIGANATILPNIQIGANCVIGAGAVVTKNVSDDSVVYGITVQKLNKNG